MCAFLKSIDEKGMEITSQRWKLPTKTDVEGKIVPKDEEDWTSEEDTFSTKNPRALNAIFNGVDPSQFKMISTAEVAKEACDILHVHFEGTHVVHESRLELLTTKFENLRMSEKETISDFSGKLCDIANVGENIS